MSRLILSTADVEPIRRAKRGSASLCIYHKEGEWDGKDGMEGGEGEGRTLRLGRDGTCFSLLRVFVRRG